MNVEATLVEVARYAAAVGVEVETMRVPSNERSMWEPRELALVPPFAIESVPDERTPEALEETTPAPRVENWTVPVAISVPPMNAPPWTSSLLVGEVVPMPTLPPPLKMAS